MLAIVQHTPAWAWAVLALLVVLGLQALRPRTVPVWRLMLVPAVFILWGVATLTARAAAAPLLGLDWLVAAAIGFAIASLTGRLESVRIDRAAGQVHMPGSAVPLARNLAIFIVKYVLTAAMAVAPALQPSLSPWDVGVSGLMAGYFIGWTVRLARKYRASAQVESALSAG